MTKFSLHVLEEMRGHIVAVQLPAGSRYSLVAHFALESGARLGTGSLYFNGVTKNKNIPK